METPRRKAKRKLHLSQPIDWRESPQRRRSPVKPVRPGLDQLNAIAVDSDSDSDLDRNVLEILSPTRPSINTATPHSPAIHNGAGFLHTNDRCCATEGKGAIITRHAEAIFQLEAGHADPSPVKPYAVKERESQCPHPLPSSLFIAAASMTSPTSYRAHDNSNPPPLASQTPGVAKTENVSSPVCSPEEENTCPTPFQELAGSSDTDSSTLPIPTRRTARKVVVISSDESSNDESSSVCPHPHARERVTTTALLSSMDNLPPISEGEHSEYSSGTGTLTLNLPNNFRRLPVRKKFPPVTEIEGISLMHSSGSSSAFVAPNGTSGTVATLDSDEEDMLEVDQLLSHRSPRKRAGKRISTWSVIGEAEVVAISSDEASDLENPSTPALSPTKGNVSQPTFPKSSTSDDRPGLTLSSRDENISEIPKVKPSVIKKHSTEKHRAQRRNAANLAKYALDLYNSLNHQVFGDKLPRGCYQDGLSSSSEKEFCEIIWSKTLMTTAGRAVIKRTANIGPNVPPERRVFIELATKVVDSQERVRNTLSHEMCHLAVWVIDQSKDGGHGRAFRSWAGRVMQARQDVHITSTHSYEIVYKYEWKCVTCSQIYGRHSKSIDTSMQRCGVCKGELRALFGEAKSTGWAAFLRQRLQPFKASRPELSHSEAMKELGRIWKTVSSTNIEDSLDEVLVQLEAIAL